MAKNDGNISIGLNMDTKDFNKQIKSIDKALNDLSKLLSNLSKTLDSSLDTSSSVRELDNLSDGVSDLERDISGFDADIDLNDSFNFDDVERNLNSLANEVDNVLGDIDGRQVNIDVNIDYEAGGIEHLESDLDSIDGRRINVNVGVNADSDGISTLDRTLSDTESTMRDTARESGVLDDSLDDLDDSARKSSDGFTILKGAMADIAADAITSGVSSFTEAMFDADKAAAGFQAQMGLSADEMAAYNDAIQSTYLNNFGESLSDVSTNMAKISQATGELDPSKLQEMTESAFTLQDTFDMDMSETIRGVNALMTHFGMTSTQAFDFISTGAQKGLNYTDELGDNLSEYSGKFAEAGYSAEEYFQLLENGTAGGAYNLDKVNDSINEVTTRLADGTIAETMSTIDEKTGEVVEGTAGWSLMTEDLFESWQKGEATQKDVIGSIVADINNCEDQQKALNMAATAFGTMAEDGGLEAIKSLTSVGDSYDNVNGKMKEIGEVKYSDAMSQLETLGRTIEQEIFPAIAEKALPALQEFVSWATDNLDSIIETVKVVGTVLAGVFVASKVVGFVTAIQGIVTAVKSWEIATKLQAAAQGILNAVMNANPIGIIITAIGLLVGAFVILWNSSEDFRNFWIGLWGAVVDAVGGVVDFLVGVFNGIVDFFKNNWQSILLFLVNPFAGAFKLLYDNFEGFREFIDGFIQGVIEFFTILGESLAEIWQNISDFFVETWNTMYEFVSGVLDTIWETISSVWNSIYEAISGVLTSIWETISSVWTTIVTSITGFVTSIWTTITTIFNNIKTSIEEVFTAVWSFITNIWSNISSTVSNFIGTIRDNIVGVFTSVKDTVSNIFTGVKDAVIGAFTGIRDGIKGVINGIISAVEFMANCVIDGVNMAIGALNGLSFDIPDWVPFAGGEKFGFNIPKLGKLSIPRLANGAVINPNQEFLAVLGDQKQGVNIETPLNTMVDAFKTALNDGNYSGEGDIVIPVYLGSDMLDEVVVDASRRATYRNNGR